MDVQPHFTTDRHLLSLARDVLSSDGYEHEQIALGDEAGLLAENEYAIIALTAAATVAEVEFAESALANYLIGRTEGVDLRAKAWDMYLVILSQEELTEHQDCTSALFEIVHDTSWFRRIVKVGVPATPDGAHAALSSFVSLLPPPAVLAEPLLASLYAALADRGPSGADA